MNINWMKRIAAMIVFVVLLTAVPYVCQGGRFIAVYAAAEETEAPEVIASGNCGKTGDNVKWAFDSAGTLSITGEGEMTNYVDVKAPWYAYRKRITTIVIGEGVTYAGAQVPGREWRFWCRV